MSLVSQGPLWLATVLAVSASVHGQTVQLPTFRQFSVSTTVTVPDRGGVYLGGVNRASSAAGARGAPLIGALPGLGGVAHGRGIARTTSAASASVHATIIDHAELDRRLLAEAVRRRRARGNAVDESAARQAQFLSQHIGRSSHGLTRSEPMSATAETASVQQLRQRDETSREIRRREAVTYYDKGRAALANGRQGAAKVYLKMADRRAEGELKRQIAGALAELTVASH